MTSLPVQKKTHFIGHINNSICISFQTIMFKTFSRSYTFGIFPMEPSQGTGVSRRSDNTNGLSCSSACCLCFGGPRDAETCDDSHSTACSSLPRHARRTL
ncbi:hypothetical protein AVEN_193436-1 [Araneus ventricosus]|uniref:Uncharacterized protein n=1 Tax=Araneus ventricosus TaxID=182803 RepID=A0A4Y2G4V7_ARAVE|nr:hypothetical protein AVEN_193436-1 [Araneus ventricosus]